MTSEFWNSRYQVSDWVYGTKPNEFIAQETDKLVPGRILFPAEGEGRNAIYTAHQGWETHAFDQSDIGRSKALKRAQKGGVSIDYQLTALSGYRPEHAFDVIALCFFHMMPEQRKILHQSVIEWLAPGGKVIIESYDKTQLGLGSGGPKNIDMLFSEEDINQDFSELHCDSLTIRDRVLSEGTHHNGHARLLEGVFTKVL